MAQVVITTRNLHAYVHFHACLSACRYKIFRITHSFFANEMHNYHCHETQLTGRRNHYFIEWNNAYDLLAENDLQNLNIYYG